MNCDDCDVIEQFRCRIWTIEDLRDMIEYCLDQIEYLSRKEGFIE